jgi:hypothetical protein
MRAMRAEGGEQSLKIGRSFGLRGFHFGQILFLGEARALM